MKLTAHMNTKPTPIRRIGGRPGSGLKQSIIEGISGALMEALRGEGEFDCLDDPDIGKVPLDRGQAELNRAFNREMAEHKQRTEALARCLEDAVRERVRMDKELTAEHPQYKAEYHEPPEEIKIVKPVAKLDMLEVRVYPGAGAKMIADVKAFAKAAERFARENGAKWRMHAIADKGVPCLCFSAN